MSFHRRPWWKLTKRKYPDMRFHSGVERDRARAEEREEVNVDLFIMASSGEQVFDEGRYDEDRKNEQHEPEQAHAPHHAAHGPVSHHALHHDPSPLLAGADTGAGWLASRARRGSRSPEVACRRDGP